MFCLIALLLLTAITTSLILFSGTETSVNANYRSEEVAFFAAKSGVYEALDRMQQSNANSIACKLPTGLPGAVQSIAPGCATAPSSVLYLINSGSSLTVQPWTSTNTYVDDELCHEGFSLSGMSPVPADVPCSTVPTGSTWYATVNSNYPWSGTSAALPYEWVRINWKQNSSATYISGTGTSAANASYSVNSSQVFHHAGLLEWRVGSPVEHPHRRFPRLYELRTISNLRGGRPRHYDSSVFGHGTRSHIQWVATNGPGGGCLDPSERHRAALRD